MAGGQSSYSRPGGYWAATHQPLNSLIVIGPLLLFFQVGTLLGADSALRAPRDVYRLLNYFGATASFMPPLLIVMVLTAQHLAHRARWKPRPLVLGGMVGESALWALPLACLGMLCGRMALQAPATHPSPGVLPELLAAVGAGVYEEFIFRLAVISIMLLVLVDVLELDRKAVAAAAVVLSAALFAFYHPDSLAQPTPWPKVTFYVLAGLYLGGLYLMRGFGVAVLAHCFHNILVAALKA